MHKSSYAQRETVQFENVDVVRFKKPYQVLRDYRLREYTTRLLFINLVKPEETSSFK